MAASSPILNRLLKSSQEGEDEVKIIFPDVSGQDLKSLISFIYQGSTSTSSQEESDSLLNLLSKLQICQPSAVTVTTNDPSTFTNCETTVMTANLASSHELEVSIWPSMININRDVEVTEVSSSPTSQGSYLSYEGSSAEKDTSAMLSQIASTDGSWFDSDYCGSPVDLPCECSMTENDSATWVQDDYQSDLLLTTVDRSAILYSFSSATPEKPHQDGLFDGEQLKTNEKSGNPAEASSLGKENEFVDLNVRNFEKATTDLHLTPEPEKNKKPSYQCSLCQKHFPSRHYLRFHENSVHNLQKSLQCPFCQKSFSGGHYLRQHLQRMHSHIRQFVCDRCPAAFGMRYDLVVHQKTHEIVKAFACDTCGNNYSTRRALREHLRTHTGERPYECKDCGKRFALPKTLRVHYRQHSGERPYLCSHCGKTFVQNSTLRNHLKHHHNNEKLN